MGKTAHTYTYVELQLSEAAYNEIANKLKAAGYEHAFTEHGAIDMHGIALTKEEKRHEQEETRW